MKFIIEKDKCEISESLNGRALVIETYDPVYLEDGKEFLIYPSYFHSSDKPFITRAPESFQI